MLDWLGKKIFVETYSKRIYQGSVVDETETKIVLIDKFNHRVELSKIDIKTCEEQDFIKNGKN